MCKSCVASGSVHFERSLFHQHALEKLSRCASESAGSVPARWSSLNRIVCEGRAQPTRGAPVSVRRRSISEWLRPAQRDPLWPPPSRSTGTALQRKSAYVRRGAFPCGQEVFASSCWPGRVAGDHFTRSTGRFGRNVAGCRRRPVRRNGAVGFTARLRRQPSMLASSAVASCIRPALSMSTSSRPARANDLGHDPLRRLRIGEIGRDPVELRVVATLRGEDLRPLVAQPRRSPARYPSTRPRREPHSHRTASSKSLAVLSAPSAQWVLLQTSTSTWPIGLEQQARM